MKKKKSSSIRDLPLKEIIKSVITRDLLKDVKIIDDLRIEVKLKKEISAKFKEVLKMAIKAMLYQYIVKRYSNDVADELKEKFIRHLEIDFR